MNNRTWIIGAFIIAIPIAVWLLLPMEPTAEGEKVVGIVQEHIAARGNRAAPRPYYRVALNNGLVVDVQDYGRVSAKNGDSVILQMSYGVITNRRNFNILGKSNAE